MVAPSPRSNGYDRRDEQQARDEKRRRRHAEIDEEPPKPVLHAPAQWAHFFRREHHQEQPEQERWANFIEDRIILEHGVCGDRKMSGNSIEGNPV